MNNQKQLRLMPLWLLIGYSMVFFVVYMSLVSSPPGMSVLVSDKIYHFIGYFVMMAWFAQIYHSAKPRYIAGAGLFLMGIALEVLQGLGGIRQFEFADMLFNTAGVIVAWFISRTRFSQALILIESRLLFR